jgi:hypothetical protein
MVGSDPDPDIDTKLGEVTKTETTAGDDHTVTVALPYGQSLIYSRITDNVKIVSRLSKVRSVNRNGE